MYSYFNNNSLAIIMFRVAQYKQDNRTKFLVFNFNVSLIKVPYNFVSFLISVAIAVPTTAIVSAVIAAVISSLITYCCCVIKTKTKALYTVSHTNTAAAEYETPVQTSASPLELKDNMAYGQVTNRQANTTNPLTVYETVHN